MTLRLTVLLLVTGPQPDSPAELLAEALSALPVVEAASQRVRLGLDAAEVAARADLPLAVRALLDALAGLESPCVDARAGTIRVLAAIGAEPVPWTVLPGAWPDEARASALRAFFSLDPAGAATLAESRGMPPTVIARYLTHAALTPSPDAANAARLALALLERESSPDPEALSGAVLALLRAAPEDGPVLAYSSGPARALAAELLCAEAPSAAAAVEYARSILDPARQARALVARVSMETDPAERTMVAEASLSAAGMVRAPSVQAEVLAALAAAAQSVLQPAVLGAQALEAAQREPEPMLRVTALATVAGALAEAHPPTAATALTEARALAKRLRDNGQRARALRAIGLAVAATMPEEALSIVSELGASRTASRLDVLLAVAVQGPERTRPQALRQILSAVDSWDVGPGDKLRVLQMLPPAASQEVPPPSPLPRVPELPGPSDRTGGGAGADGDNPLERRRAQTGRDGRRDPPSGGRPAVGGSDSVGSQAQDINRAVSARMSQLALARAERMPRGDLRVAAYLEAANITAGQDAARALAALGQAMTEAQRLPSDRGWEEVVLAHAACIAPASAPALAAAVPDPERRARALRFVGAPSEAMTAATAIADPRRRTAVVDDIVRAAPSKEGLLALQQALNAWAPSEERDDAVVRSARTILASGLPEARSVAEALSALASSGTALARVRLALADHLFRTGELDVAERLLAEVEPLAKLPAPPEDVVADLAVTLALAGHDGVSLARSLPSPALRASVLIRIAEALLPHPDNEA